MDKALFFLQLLGSAILSYMVSIAVHEWGHVISGLAQGWKLLLITTGPFKLYRNDINDKVRFGIEKNPLYWCGVGGTIPAKKEDAKIEIFAKILIAGPLASIALGLAAGITLIWYRPFFLIFLAPVALGMGIACLIPGMKTGILYNDGSRYMRIKKGGQTYLEEKAVFDTTMQTSFDKKTACTEEGINALIESKDAEFRYMGHYYAYLNAKAEGNNESMSRELVQMDELKNKVPKAIIDMCAEL